MMVMEMMMRFGLYLPSRDWGLAHRTCYLCLNKVVVVVIGVVLI